ncbi:MAG TPA: hypothetical protein VGI97_00575 [Gemmatimonadaceae bacterium]
MKPLCLALCVALAATGARASDPVYVSPDPAPDVYGPLVWRAGGVDVHGFWFTDKQTQAVDLRIKYLEDKAAKECTDATNAETKKVLGAAPTLWIVGAGALVLGLVGGFYLGRK